MISRRLPPSFRRAIAGLLSGAVVFASALHASAADQPVVMPQSVAVDLKRLGEELDLFAAAADRTRLATALTGLGVGAALVPSGIVLFGRTDDVPRALVIGMIVGGSAQIASVPFVLLPTRMDEIRHQFKSRPVHLDSEVTVRALEDEWRLAAEAGRRKRTYVGTTLLIVGAVSLATALTLLLASEGILGLSRKAQYTVGGSLMGVGVSLPTFGVRLLLEWSLEETSWEAYRTMKFDAGRLGRLPSPSIGVVPMPDGALAFATMPF